MTDDQPGPTHVCFGMGDEPTRLERIADEIFDFWYHMPWYGRVVVFGMFPAAILFGAVMITWAVLA